MSIARPTVFVVDDDESICASLSLLVESADWQAITFRSGREFLRHPRVTAPHCVVLDLLLPDLNGLEVQDLVAECSGTPIIFITGHGDVAATVRAMKAGAVDFLTKPLPSDVLLNAIRHALIRSQAELAHAAEIRSLLERYARLSRREREVMALVVSGRLNKQTASDLGISEITVKAHRGSLMTKMKARSLPELVTMAERILPSPSDSATNRPSWLTPALQR